MGALVSRAVTGLAGDITVPGDKSISHRALLLGALAIGETRITGLLEGEDVLATAAALRQLGVRIACDGDGAWRVQGVGVGGLSEPGNVLDLGNSGTSARLLMGVLATHPFTSFLTGDDSLRARPMGRVAEPVERMGARVVPRSGGRLPLAITGAVSPLPITYELPVPSAQVKSAVLLAGLNAPGTTTVVETLPSRDHTELMLGHFGARLDIAVKDDGGRTIALSGQPELAACPVAVPGDPSSAAFVGVAALIVSGAEVTVRNVGMNPTRAGLFATLEEMGADITLGNQRSQAGEPVADLTFRSSNLRGIQVPAERAPSMIDEYPVLAAAAACATGITHMAGLAELRVKESDRLAAIAEGLTRCGVAVEAGPDSLTVTGAGGPPAGGARVTSALDHRIAMAFVVLGMACAAPVTIDDDAAIATSFPGFAGLMNRLGADIEAANGQ